MGRSGIFQHQASEVGNVQGLNVQAKPSGFSWVSLDSRRDIAAIFAYIDHLHCLLRSHTSQPWQSRKSQQRLKQIIKLCWGTSSKSHCPPTALKLLMHHSNSHLQQTPLHVAQWSCHARLWYEKVVQQFVLFVFSGRVLVRQSGLCKDM